MFEVYLVWFVYFVVMFDLLILDVVYWWVVICEVVVYLVYVDEGFVKIVMICGVEGSVGVLVFG